VTVGFGVGGNGTLTTSGSGTLNISDLGVGSAIGTGTATIGGQATVSGGTEIGDGGTGTLNIADGATMTSDGGSSLGTTTGSLGTAEIDGTWQQGPILDPQPLLVGVSGRGSVVDEGSLQASDVIIGANDGSDNSNLTFMQAQPTSLRDIIVGSSGTARMNVWGGTQLGTEDVLVGAGSSVDVEQNSELTASSSIMLNNLSSAMSLDSGGVAQAADVETSGPITIGSGSLIAGIGNSNQKGPISIESGGSINETRSGAQVSAGTITVDFGGALKGAGNNTVTTAGDTLGEVVNEGTVVPGPTGASTLNVSGYYTQQNDGELDIELSAASPGTFITNSDELTVTNQAKLGGSLIVTAAPGVDTTAYPAGTKFWVLTAGAVTGTFSNLAPGRHAGGNGLPALGNNLEWNVTYLSNKVVLEVVGPLACAIPNSNEGSVATMTATLVAPAMQPTEATVTWGDGTSDTWPIAQGDTAMTATHTYADNGSYPVHMTYMEGDGEFTADATAVVNNVAPTLSNLAIPPSKEGSLATLTGTITDPGILDTQSVVVQWGDGTSSTVAVGAGATSFTAIHTYADNGNDAVIVTDTDKDGGVGTGSATAVVNNVAPIVTQLAITTSLEGAPSTSPAVLTGSFTDPGTLDTHTVVINWGDGSAPSTVYAAAGALSFSGVMHSYPNIGSGQPGSSSGTYPITVTVTDKDGGVGTGGVTAHVNDVPPTLSDVAVSSSNEGSSATLSGVMYDPGPFDWFIMKINCAARQAVTIFRVQPGEIAIAA